MCQPSSALVLNQGAPTYKALFKLKSNRKTPTIPKDSNIMLLRFKGNHKKKGFSFERELNWAYGKSLNME